MGFDVNRLLDTPSSKWLKDDWKNAAKLLATTRPKGIIEGVLHDKLVKDISMNVNSKDSAVQLGPKNIGGRKEKLTPEKVEHQRAAYEETRRIIAQEKNVSFSEVKDKEVCRRLAEISFNNQKGRRVSKSRLIELHTGRLKYLKQKVKTGK